ncbi:hypothetical protein K438DRAFT_1974862 [Mycena galopus ATCC 62051]|nr:hypothetical protein K438DRAFT_1974862 [Mycena galopus ATCC 62051]
MSFLEDGNVILCQNLPGQPGAHCTTLVKSTSSHMHVRDTILSFDDRASISQDMQECAISLMWLEDILSDASREDFGTLLYHIWLLTLSVVTLLNESLPHLFAGLAARALALAWAGFRVQGNRNLLTTYYMSLALGNAMAMTSWELIVGVVSNSVNFVIIAWLTYKLFTVYASQTFSTVGASTEVNRIYKLVLLLSVILQLAGFFILGQSALWISKISFGAIRTLADDFFIYVAELVVTTVLVIPWLILGWVSVRRESKSLFLVFCVISFLLLGMSTALFFSPQWSFYATMTVVSYILLVATFVLAIVCRLQFGKGLAHFLRVTDALEDGDFTPVYFSKGDDTASYIEDDTKSQFDPERTPAHGRSMSIFFENSTGTSPAETIKLSSSPAQFHSATENRVSVSPIVVEPVTRSSSVTSSKLNSSSPSRFKGVRPPVIKTGANLAPVLPAISISPMYRHSRSETVDERQGRTVAPAKPVQAAVRSSSLPRRQGARRPSDAKAKPTGNYF